MRLPEIPARRRVGLTALIDVVFILLMFFMIATTFSRYGAYETALAGGGRATDSPPKLLLVSVSANDRWALNEQVMARDQLVQELQGRAHNNAVRVALAAGVGASAQDVIEALEALHQAGINDVAIKP